MRLHPRYFIVAKAQNALYDEVLRIERESELTANELVVILSGILADYVKFPLRAERHPNDPDKKANEA